MSVSLYFPSHLQLEQHHRHSDDAGNQVLSASQFNSNMPQNGDSDSLVNSVESSSEGPEQPSCLPEKPIRHDQKDGDRVSVSTSDVTKNKSEVIQLDQLESHSLEKDRNFLEMIKSRPKRPKVNSNRPRKLPTIATNSEQSLVDERTKIMGKENIDLNAGLEGFFQSPSTQLRRKKFANDETSERTSLRSSQRISLVLPSEKRSSLRKEEKVDDESGESKKEDEGKLTAKHEKVSRSKSSPSIDPTKLLPGMDPRLSVSMIKELKTRQTSSNSSEKVANRLSHPLFSELKLQSLRVKTRESSSSGEPDKKQDPEITNSTKRLSVKDRISAFGEFSKPNIQSSSVAELARKSKDDEAKTKSSQSNEEPTKGEEVACEKDSSKNGSNVGRESDEKEKVVPKMGSHELPNLKKSSQDKERK